VKGLLLKSTGSWYSVKLENGDKIECRIKGNFRIKGVLTTNPLAAGDHVIIERDPDGTGVITGIEPRRNYIIRKSVNLSRQAHIIAANLDQAMLLITTKQPETPFGFVDRFLVTAEAYSIPTILVFNKSDIYSEEELEIVHLLINEYEKIGYRCILHSSLNDPPDTLREILKDKVTLVSGNSGVGKSSLINSVQTELGLKTGKISGYHEKGMHTTTFAEMFELSFGGYLIDTPGIKGFGLIDMERKELAHYFPEMRKMLNQCKFNNCQHINEPGCAIKEAVEKGIIWENRYMNYLSIYHDDEEESYRGSGY
jgi:ribosome biogenesis GTPase / thiamine phosphate phosphatase